MDYNVIVLEIGQWKRWLASLVNSPKKKDCITFWLYEEGTVGERFLFFCPKSKKLSYHEDISSSKHLVEIF
jgi:hypothetical protein